MVNVPANMPSDEIDEALRALAHPSRRAVIRLTTPREVPASEFAELLGIAPATASEHLKVLRKTGLVQLTATGTWRHYRADLSRVGSVLNAITQDLHPPPHKEHP